MAFRTKVLWAVSMTAAQEATLAAHAKAAGANAVCIRTSNTRLAGAIGRFHALGIKVYGWRWPAAKPIDSASHYYALDEADFVAGQLIPQGLDGYIADIESEADGRVNDWNNASFGPLATTFCSKIKTAAAAAGLGAFRFGLTSGCAYPDLKMRPNIPWAQFGGASNLLLPQTYWRWTNGENHVEPINGGSPDAAITKGVDSWARIAAGKAIVPMAGELDVITAAEIAGYGARMAALGHDELHFYADANKIDPANLAAIAAL